MFVCLFCIYLPLEQFRIHSMSVCLSVCLSVSSDSSVLSSVTFYLLIFVPIWTTSFDERIE